MDAAEFAPIEHHAIRVETLSDDPTDSESGKSYARLWPVTWTYPDASDARILWESRCELAADDERCEFSLRIRVDSLHYIVEPPRFQLRPPHLTQSIVQKFQCSLGGRPIPWRSTSVS